MCLLRMRSEMIEGIEVRGTAGFRSHTRESLRRLRSTSQFELIRGHIGVIRQGKRSGMKAWRKKPTFVVGKRTWQHSALWYAGAIAHDAYHAKLYLDAKQKGGGKKPAADCWTGAESEKQCLRFQRQVLLEIYADEETIAYIEECAKSPAYQGRNQGWRSWLDYLRRWW